MTGLTVSSYVVLESPSNPGGIVSHAYLNGAPVLTCWHHGWKDYLRLMNLERFERVTIRAWGARGD